MRLRQSRLLPGIGGGRMNALARHAVTTFLTNNPDDEYEVHAPPRGVIQEPWKLVSVSLTLDPRVEGRWFVTLGWTR